MSLRRWGLLGAMLLATLGIAGGAGGANNTYFQDPVGDNQKAANGAYASDIQQVQATSDDLGNTKIAVTLLDGPARLVGGDELDVYIDYDRNTRTGDQQGFDTELIAEGNASGPPSFFFCYLAAPRTCQQGVPDFGHDTPAGTGRHTVDFNITTGIAAFDFGVIETYTYSGTTLADVAPNNGLYTFQELSDPDHDRKYGRTDQCPTVRAVGKFDRNNNGCPGPFSRIAPDRPGWARAVRAGNDGLLTGLFVARLPTGANVAVGTPIGTFSARANSSGMARLWRGTKRVRLGSVFRLRVTKPAWIGVFRVYVLTASGLRLRSQLCIPATGSRKAVRCSAKLKGR
jgi:hypothetical protein